MMKPILIITGLFILLLVSSASVAAAEQGWKFRSDLSNSGMYDDGGMKPDGTLLWNFTTGGWIQSTPAVAGGMVYFGSHDDKVYALDAGTGAFIWGYTTEGNVWPSPAVTGGIVYTGDYANNVYALDAETGALIWRYTAGGSITSSPAVADGVVYIGSHDRKVYALDAETGAFLWSYMTGGEVTSGPAVVNGVVYVGSYDDRVYALDASSGAHIWNFSTGKEIHSSPAVVDDIVYFGSWDHDVYAVNASTGALLWNFTTGGDVFSSIAIADGIAYIGGPDGIVYALDAETGTQLWDYTTGDSISASPAVADGVLYIRSNDRNLYAFDAQAGTLLWNCTVGTGGFSSPVVANGAVYFGDLDGNLYAVGSSPGNPPAYDDFNDNVTNTTLWNILEYGGPYVNETNQRLEITIPPDSSGDTFSAGYASKCALRGDFDVCVDYHLLTWPENSGVRAGLWIERSPSTYTVERVSYSSSDYFDQGDHYTTNFADSILLSVTDDTDGRIRLVRTGTTFKGYYFDEISHDWVLLQSIQGNVMSSRDVTFMMKAWSHDYAFGDELVKVAFDNFVINKGEVILPGPPAGVTNLQNTTYQPTQIRWTWNDPGNINFDHVMVYLDGVFRKNVTAGTETWTATGLAPATEYTIGTRTIGTGGLVSETWVNHTATTNPLSISHLDPSDVIEGSPAFTLNVYGTGFGGSCSVFWNGDEQPTQFLDPGHMRIEVLPEMINQPGLMSITVHDSTTGEVSNSVVFHVRDPFSVARGWKFRSDSSNSGVYDDCGTRPGNELLWKYMTESYYGSSPTVVHGIVCINGIYDLLALDAFTGELLWTSPKGGGMSSPVVAGGVVYVGSNDRNIYALDTSTGDPLWQYTTGGLVYSSPAVAYGVVYAGSWDQNFYALDANTGALLWNYTTGGEVRSSPAVVDGTVYFGSRDHRLYALDAHTGALLWNYTTGGEMLASSPAVAGGIVYIQSAGTLHALDALEGTLLWSHPVPGSGDSSPAVVNGVVYIGTYDGNLYALDAVSGDLLWEYATGSAVRSSPSVANGVVYFGNNAGTITSLDAGTGDLIWDYATDETAFSSPAIANGVVYAQGYNGYLYALATLPDDPPGSVTDLHVTTINGAEIAWAWTDPATLGFSHVMVSLDGAFQENMSAGRETWTATGLAPSTVHTIGIRAVGKKGAINATLVTHTATTGTLSISTLDPASVVEDSSAFTLSVHGTGFTPTSSILWNGEEQSTSYLQADHLSMDVPAEYVAHSRRVTITVYDPASGESSNAVIFPVTDNPATAKGRKFRSDLTNSGVYDDSGRRPAPTLLWTYTTGLTVTSSPSVVDGVVYIGSLDRNLYALDATTGALLWKYDIGERNDYVSSSPAVSNGVVYIGGLKTKIHALDAYTGDLQWKYKLPIRTTVRSGVSSSAAVADGVVYIGNMDGNLYAFSEENGDLLWSYAIPVSVYDEHIIFSSPAVADGVVYVNTYGGGLYALDASTGSLLWNYSAEGDYGAYSSPAVANGVVYVGSGYTNKKLYAVDALTGDLLWDFTTGGSVSSSPAVANGVVFFGSNDNTTYALNASTGDLLWNFTTGGRVISSPAVADGVVYFGSYDNTTYALDASTGALIWSYATGGRVTSSPAVANGIVYFGSDDGTVYALGTLPLDPPVAAFTSDVTSGGAPLEVLFSDTSTGIVTTRSWDFGDGTTAWSNETLTVSHTYLFPGTFTVSLTAGNIDGQDTEMKTGYTQVNPMGSPPRAWFTASPMMGSGPLTVSFTDRSMGTPAAWQWDFGDGNTSSERNPAHTYATTGKYTPTLTVFNAGGRSSYSSFVWVSGGTVVPTVTPTQTVSPKPTVPLGKPPISFFSVSKSFGLAPTTVQFIDWSFNSPNSWHWDFGDGTTSNLQNPSNTFMNPGTYPVSLTVTNAYGESTSLRRVYVR